MDSVLFCIPIKAGALDQYLAFAKETSERPEEYGDMFKRYDITSVKVWVAPLDGRDYAFVYHEVGPEFAKKMEGWDDSPHPFDTWFRESLMAVYDVDSVGTVEPPKSVLEFRV